MQAIALGRADRALLATPPNQLSLAEGRRLYLQHVTRPRVVGGARPASAKRYRPVLDKFEAFAYKEGLTGGNQVTRRTLEAYAAHLDDGGFAYATGYLESTTLKQLIKWLVQEGHLPASAAVQLPLAKPHEPAPEGPAVVARGSRLAQSWPSRLGQSGLSLEVVSRHQVGKADFRGAERTGRQLNFLSPAFGAGKPPYGGGWMTERLAVVEGAKWRLMLETSWICWLETRQQSHRGRAGG